jgi:hypothetical protein
MSFSVRNNIHTQLSGFTCEADQRFKLVIASFLGHAYLGSLFDSNKGATVTEAGYVTVRMSMAVFQSYASRMTGRMRPMYS